MRFVKLIRLSLVFFCVCMMCILWGGVFVLFFFLERFHLKVEFGEEEETIMIHSNIINFLMEKQMVFEQFLSG